MAERKQTPDVLGEILGEVGAVELPVSEAPAAPAAQRRATPPGRAGRAPGPSPELRTQNSKLICWEHRVVSFQNYRGWRPRYVDGAEVTEWMAGPLLHDCLHELGAEGWEVAGAAAGQPLYGSADGYQVFFKRIKDQ